MAALGGFEEVDLDRLPYRGQLRRNFTPDEKRRFKKLLDLGLSWPVIAERMPGRTVNTLQVTACHWGWTRGRAKGRVAAVSIRRPNQARGLHPFTEALRP